MVDTTKKTSNISIVFSNIPHSLEAHAFDVLSAHITSSRGTKTFNVQIQKFAIAVGVQMVYMYALEKKSSPKSISTNNRSVNLIRGKPV